MEKYRDESAAQEQAEDKKHDRDDWKDLEKEDPLLPTQEVPQKDARKQTAYLDGLRGFAAFLVYMSHHVPWWYGMDNALNHGFGWHGERYFATFPYVRSFFTGGNAGVSIFFVLSGYVLSISPLRKLREGKVQEVRQSLISAAIRRPIRLFIPPLGISLAFALIMHLPFGLAPHLEWPVAVDNVFAELQKWVVEGYYMMSPLEPHGVNERWFCYDPPAWTMAIEFEGSMVVYALLAGFGFAVPHYRAYLFVITGFFFLFIFWWAMASFCFGVALAMNDIEGFDRTLIFKRFGITEKAQQIFFHVIFFSSWYLLDQPAGNKGANHLYETPGWYHLSKLIPYTYWDDEYWRFLNTFGAVGVVYAVLRIKWLQNFFSRPSLQYLGKVSFSLYLLHIPFLWTFGDRTYRLIGVARQDFKTWYDGLLRIPDIGLVGISTGFLVGQAIILPLNLMLAELCTKWLDEPSVKVGRWVVNKLGLR